jgi:hypothetical protein
MISFGRREAETLEDNCAVKSADIPVFTRTFL